MNITPVDTSHHAFLGRHQLYVRTFDVRVLFILPFAATAVESFQIVSEGNWLRFDVQQVAYPTSLNQL
jgi:hypothetical protein